MIELTGDTELAVKLDAMPKGVARSLVKGMVQVGLGLLAHLKENQLSGQALGVRTGTGRRSSFYRVETEGTQDVAVLVGNDLTKAKYMRAQDRGADVTPKTARSLTIPIGVARTGKGVARFSARDVISNPGSFGYVGTFTRDGIIFGTKGKKEKPTPLFILASHVRLRAVGFLMNTRNEKRAWAQSVINDAVNEGLSS